MKYSLLIFILLSGLAIQGRPVRYISGSPTDTPATYSVARDIVERYSTQAARIRAAYLWVTNNIRYDKDSSFILNSGPNERAKIDEAMRRRRGVCENFAAIFAEICQRAGLKVFVVTGYTRSQRGVETGGHAWCAGMVGGDWYFFDPTWDAGGNQTFFMIPPETFIQTHMPFDPIWQLLEFPVSNADFGRGIFTRSWTRKALNYKDSIAAFLSTQAPIQLENVVQRMETAGLSTSEVKANYTLMRMHLEMHRQEEQIIRYDGAIALVNKAVARLNRVIEHYNENDTLYARSIDVTGELETAEKALQDAHVLLRKVDASKATLVMGTWQLKERIEQLAEKIQMQKAAWHPAVLKASPIGHR